MNNTNLILSDESEKMKNRELLEEYFSCSLEIEWQQEVPGFFLFGVGSAAVE